MDKINYQEFVEQVEKGKILIGVEPAIARQFFTDTKHSVIKEEIGEALFIERFFVKTFLLLEYVCLLVGIIASVYALKWYSIIAIPFMIINTFILSGKASMGIQKIGGAIFLVIVFVLLAYYFKDKGFAMVLWLILLPLPFFCAHMTYKLATIFLRCLSVRNEKAYNMLYEKVIFLK